MTDLDQPSSRRLVPPPGYEDVHPELVIEDAWNDGWEFDFLRDEDDAVAIALARPEGYERSGAAALTKEAVRPQWPSWKVLKAEATQSTAHERLNC